MPFKPGHLDEGMLNFQVLDLHAQRSLSSSSSAALVSECSQDGLSGIGMGGLPLFVETGSGKGSLPLATGQSCGLVGSPLHATAACGPPVASTHRSVYESTFSCDSTPTSSATRSELGSLADFSTSAPTSDDSAYTQASGQDSAPETDADCTQAPATMRTGVPPLASTPAAVDAENVCGASAAAASQQPEAGAAVAGDEDGPFLPRAFHPDDVQLARVLASVVQAVNASPAQTLQALLNFGPEDFQDLVNTLSDSGGTCVYLLTCHLHNLRTMAEEAIEDTTRTEDEAAGEPKAAAAAGGGSKATPAGAACDDAPADGGQRSKAGGTAATQGAREARNAAEMEAVCASVMDQYRRVVCRLVQTALGLLQTGVQPRKASTPPVPQPGRTAGPNARFRIDSTPRTGFGGGSPVVASPFSSGSARAGGCLPPTAAAPLPPPPNAAGGAIVSPFAVAATFAAPFAPATTGPDAATPTLQGVSQRLGSQAASEVAEAPSGQRLGTGAPQPPPPAFQATVSVPRVVVAAGGSSGGALPGGFAGGATPVVTLGRQWQPAPRVAQLSQPPLGVVDSGQQQRLMVAMLPQERGGFASRVDPRMRLYLQQQQAQQQQAAQLRLQQQAQLERQMLLQAQQRMQQQMQQEMEQQMQQRMQEQLQQEMQQQMEQQLQMQQQMQLLEVLAATQGNAYAPGSVPSADAMFSLASGVPQHDPFATAATAQLLQSAYGAGAGPHGFIGATADESCAWSPAVPAALSLPLGGMQMAASAQLHAALQQQRQLPAALHGALISGLAAAPVAAESAFSLPHAPGMPYASFAAPSVWPM